MHMPFRTTALKTLPFSIQSRPKATPLRPQRAWKRAYRLTYIGRMYILFMCTSWTCADWHNCATSIAWRTF